MANITITIKDDTEEVLNELDIEVQQDMTTETTSSEISTLLQEYFEVTRELAEEM